MKYLILGGTGTLGRELIKQLLAAPETEEIRIFSRDEFKQSQMKNDHQDHRLRFYLGDIRTRQSMAIPMTGVDIVYHVAALKQIDTLEDNPLESVYTNIFGTINVAQMAINKRVKFVCFSSTDKAVDPINVYGMCKGVSEKILHYYNKNNDRTRFNIFRWGNVLGSRGSFLHLLEDKISKGEAIPITDIGMTRFWILIQDAVSFMIENSSEGGGVFIPPIKSAPLVRVIKSYIKLKGLDPEEFKFEQIGIRPGEKIHERLISSEEHPYKGFSGTIENQFTENELIEVLGMAMGMGMGH